MDNFAVVVWVDLTSQVEYLATPTGTGYVYVSASGSYLEDHLQQEPHKIAWRVKRAHG